MKKKTISD